MTTNFPSSIDAFTNPTSADTLDNPPHDQQHADINDAMEAVQAKVGVDGSAVTSSLDFLVRSACPVGSVMPFAGSSSPDSTWLICDGSALSRTLYPTLFALIGTTYGVGDGSTTFNIPNMKGRVPVGLDSTDTDFDSLGETGGAKTHSLTEAELASHSHSNSLTNSTVAHSGHAHEQAFPIHPTGGGGSGGPVAATPWNTSVFGISGTAITYPNTGIISITGSASPATGYPYMTSGPNQTITVGINNASAGSGNAHNNVQPYIALNYVMKVA